MRRLRLIQTITVGLGLLILMLLVALSIHTPASHADNNRAATGGVTAADAASTEVVRLGLHLRALGPVDTGARTFQASFDLWLVGNRLPDPADLVFDDATAPVRLGEPIVSRTVGDQQYRLYRSDGTFRYQPSTADLLDGRLNLGIAVTEGRNTATQWVIRPDARAGDLLPDTSAGPIITADGGWTIEQARLAERTVALPTLGDPAFLDASSKHAGVVAQFTLLQTFPDAGQLLQQLVPGWLALPLLPLMVVVLVAVPILGRREPMSGSWRILGSMFALTLLLSAAGKAFATFLALRLAPASVQAVMDVFTAACLLLAAAWLIALMPVLVWHPMARRTGTPPSALERTVVNIVIVLTFALFMLSRVLHLSASSIAAASGVLTIVLGIALQNIILDLFSGILLNLEKPFRLLDWVTVSAGGAPVHGQIRNMNWRTTQLQTRDNDIVSIPNSAMARATVNNHAVPSRATRWKLEFVLNPNADPQLARRVMREAALRSAEQGLILDQPPPNVVVREVEDYGVRYRVLFYLNLNITPDLPAQNSVAENVLDALAKAGIKLAFRNYGIFVQPDQPNQEPALAVTAQPVSRLSLVRPPSEQQAGGAELPLSTDELGRILASWHLAGSLGDKVAILFYERLFEIAPHLKPLFRSDQKTQRIKLMAMLSMLVKSLKRPESVMEALADLGLRHRGFGVKPADYDAVGAALLWALQRSLGDAFDASTRAAWAKLYEAIAGVMIGAASEKAA